jgi:hypothetical protein
VRVDVKRRVEQEVIHKRNEVNSKIGQLPAPVVPLFADGCHSPC